MAAADSRQRKTRPLIIGHRGAPGYRPEHTATSYSLACELGADAVEPDVVATKDGVLVVRHENEISGTTDVAEHQMFAERKTTKVVDGQRLTGWFTEDFTWAELQTLRSRERLARLRADNREFDGVDGILRLRDVLAILDTEREAQGRDIGVVIEIKHANYFASLGHDLGDLVRRDLEACGWHDRPAQVTIECFELTVLDQVKAAGVQCELVLLLEREGAPADQVALYGADARPFAWYKTDEGLQSLVGRFDGISVAKSDLLVTNLRGKAVRANDLVARAHARGLLVYTWTFRPERYFLNSRFHTVRRAADWGDWQGEFRMLTSSGVDGIFVDHPDLGVRARDSL